MSKVKGASFGVRFYRRGVKVSVPYKSAAQDNVQTPMMDIPEQDVTFSPPSFKREEIREAGRTVFNKIARKGFPYRIFHGVSCAVARYRLSLTPPVVQAPKIPAKLQPAKGDRLMIGANEQALWAAAYSGDCYMIRMLVMEGVDIEARDGEGRTAINIATQYGRRDALKTLLAAKEMRYLASLGKLPDTNFFRKFQKAKTGS